MFFVALSAIFFHFFIKATLPSLFYLPIAYGQLAAYLAGFAPADGIGQFKLGNAEVFKQVPDVRMVVNGQHDFSFTLTHYFGQQLILRPIKSTVVACSLPIRRIGVEEGVLAVVSLETTLPRLILDKYPA